MNLQDKIRILLYGRTNSGKTAQIGKLAEHVLLTTGLKTRLYTSDLGGIRTIKPYVDLGVIEAVERGDTDIWLFVNAAVRGKVRGPNGRWTEGDNSKIGLYAFESFRSMAETMKEDMAQKSAKGINIGGPASISFTTTGEGETLKVSSGNQGQYGMAQERITAEIWQSFRLAAPYILWTSSVSKDEDATASGKILGPDVIGKALTAETPRWFDFTFRLDVLPARDSKPERHILYLGTHVDVNSGGAAGLGNIRLPLDATVLKETAIEPADIVKALNSIRGGYDEATEAIKRRLGNKLALVK